LKTVHKSKASGPPADLVIKKACAFHSHIVVHCSERQIMLTMTQLCSVGCGLMMMPV